MRADRGINKPEDLKGKWIGVPEYQLTANVWGRLLFEEEYGVKASDVFWVHGGYEDPTRVGKSTLTLPSDIRLDPHKSAADWYARTNLFPIMHTLNVGTMLADNHPWLPGALVKASGKSKALALARLTDTAATNVTLPFVEDHLRAARKLIGFDFWSYGFAKNGHVVDRFLARHCAEALSGRRLKARELFHPASLNSFRI